MSTPAIDDFQGTDRFEVHGRLGEGGMGVVYRVLDHELGIVVALKTLAHMDANGLYKLKQEFRALADVSHPNLVVLHELVSSDSGTFFTMELVEGIKFTHYVRGGEPLDTMATVPPLDMGALRSSLRQLVQALCALHEAGKMHRDIKPSNVLVNDDGDVKVLDFGLVSERDDDDKSLDGFAGTPAYMSPEQFSGQPLTGATDWYSVGIMLFEALTGRLPYAGTLGNLIAEKLNTDAPPNPADVVVDLPDDLCSLCRDMLNRAPEKRPTGAQVLERLGNPVPVPSSVGAAPTQVFVGRSDHLETLTDAFQRTREGKPVTLFVHGSSGMGKTALLEYFTGRLRRQREAVVLHGRCYERESVPYKALDTVIDALSHYLKSLPAVETAALLPRDIGALARLFPVLQRVEAVASAPARAFETPDAQELRRRGFAALKELLARIRDRRPLVIWIDDLHWGDIDSAALLTEITGPPDAPPMMLLGSYRSEERRTSELLCELLDVAWTTRIDELEVGPLSNKETRELAARLASTSWADAIAREAGGNPFYIGELVRFVAGEGSLDTGEKPTGITDVSLQQVLVARLTGLPDGARKLLEVIAVAGHPVEQGVALEAADYTSSGRDILDSLRSAYLVQTQGLRMNDWVQSFHDRVRETVVESMGKVALADTHRRLATALEDSGRADAEQLATHFREGGDAIKAARYAVEAADQAAEALAFDGAARLYRMRLELGRLEPDEERRVRTSLADALANAGQCKEAGDAYMSAAASGASRLQSLRLRVEATEQYLVGGHLPEGIRVAQQVLAELGLKLPDTARAAVGPLLWQRLLLRLRGLRFEVRAEEDVPPEELLRIDICRSIAMGMGYIDPWRTRALATLGLRLALRAGEPVRLVRLLTGEAPLLAARNQHERAERVLAITSRLCESVRDPEASGLVKAGSGTIELFRGSWILARQNFDEGTELFRDRCTGVTWQVSTARYLAIWALFFEGRFGEIARRVPAFLEESRQSGNRYAATNYRASFANVTWLVADDPARARHELEESEAAWATGTFRGQEYWQMHSGAHVDLYEGNGARAYQRVKDGWPSLRGSLLLLVPLLRLQAYYVRGCAALAAGDVKAALADAKRVSKQPFPFAVAMANLLRAGLVARGDRAAGGKLLEQTIETFDDADMNGFAAAARFFAGQRRAAAEYAEEQGIVNPQRLFSMLAPGWD